MSSSLDGPQPSEATAAIATSTASPEHHDAGSDHHPLPHANRACEACRAVKLRCLPGDPSQADPSICLRCAKSGRQCVYLPSKRRKPRKRTDTRVAELEKEIRTMRSLLSRSRLSLDEHPAETQPRKSMETTPESPVQHEAASITARSSSNGNSPIASSNLHAGRDAKGENEGLLDMLPPAKVQPSGYAEPVCGDAPLPAGSKDYQYRKLRPDVIEEGLLTMEVATQLFNRYNNQLVQHCPFTNVGPNLSAEDMRRERPILFLSMIAAGACGVLDSALYKTLDDRICRVFADQVVVNGWKSIELVQAMLLTAIWSYPPDRFADTKFYQFIHMAIAMALALNLDRDPESYRNEPSSASSQQPRVKLQPDVFERRKTMLLCYIAGASVAVALRRQNTFRLNDQLAIFIDYLGAVSTTPVEKYIYHWAQLCRIGEEMAIALRFDEPNLHMSLTETRTQMTVKAFEKQFITWERALPPDMPPSIYLTYYFNLLCLHELALHLDHRADSFQPPFYVEMVQKETTLSSAVAPAYIDSIVACIDAAHSLLDIALRMDISDLRCMPMFSYARISYAMLVVVKLGISAHTPTSKIGWVVDVKKLKAIEYCDKLILHMTDVLRPGTYRSAGKFLATLFKLKAWYTKRTSSMVSNNPKESNAQRADRIVNFFSTTPSQTEWVKSQIWNPNAPNASAPKGLFTSYDEDESSAGNMTQSESNSLDQEPEGRNSQTSTLETQTSISSNAGNSTFISSHSTLPPQPSFPSTYGAGYGITQSPTSTMGATLPLSVPTTSPLPAQQQQLPGMGYSFNPNSFGGMDDVVVNFDPRSFNIFGDMDLDMPMTGDDWKIPGVDGLEEQPDFGSMLGQF